ncbi:putative inorganic phosphate cotransporter [Choristoneura fumiferana]|uniref:putative inorganic phosphate cotransporter n=1 Tax=Choristoneura fumiferana TaxID=7141 RepID=UPI003D157891
MAVLDKTKDKSEECEDTVVGGTCTQTVGWGYRHQQCAILFCCITVAYSMRACMGVSLVAMVQRTDDQPLANISDTNTTENGGFLNALLLVPPYPKFQWSKSIQDAVLASFFWGYMVLQIPAGQLAHRFGTRYLLTGALMINCIVSFSLPWAACYGGWVLTVIFRIIQGLSQSCIVPSMHTAFGKWTPLEERGRLTSFAYGGQALGTVLGMPITGFIAASPLGWPGIFRFYGLLSGLVGGMLWWLGADTPAQHKSISANERRYIEEALGQSGNKHKKHLPVPWKKLMRSWGLYAIVVAHTGYNWGNLTLYSEVPAFMDKIMKVNIKANGLLTALPYFVQWFSNFFFSWVTDMIIVKKYLSVTNTRKLANSIGSISSTIGLITLAFVDKDIYVVETILVTICAFSISTNVGYHVNHIDIAPNFAGTLMSISNFVSNCVGSLAPIVAGCILTDVTSEYLWRKVFCVSAGFFFVTNLFYVIFGTAELADWNEPEEEVTKEDEDPMLMKERR